MRVCRVKPFYEVLTEEYPAPVCNDCSAPMMARTEVIRADGNQDETCAQAGINAAKDDLK